MHITFSRLRDLAWEGQFIEKIYKNEGFHQASPPGVLWGGITLGDPPWGSPGGSPWQIFRGDPPGGSHRATEPQPKTHTYGRRSAAPSKMAAITLLISIPAPAREPYQHEVGVRKKPPSCKQRHRPTAHGFGAHVAFDEPPGYPAGYPRGTPQESTRGRGQKETT